MEVDRFGCVVRSGWFWNALFAAGVFSHAKISMPFSNKKPVAFNWRLEATTMCCYGPIVVGAKWVELLYIWFRVENTTDLRISVATTFCAARLGKLEKSPLGNVGYILWGCKEWCEFSCECMTLSGDHLIVGGLSDFRFLFCASLKLEFRCPPLFIVY